MGEAKCIHIFGTKWATGCLQSPKRIRSILTESQHPKAQPFANDPDVCGIVLPFDIVVRYAPQQDSIVRCDSAGSGISPCIRPCALASILSARTAGSMMNTAACCPVMLATCITVQPFQMRCQAHLIVSPQNTHGTLETRLTIDPSAILTALHYRHIPVVV